MTTPRLATVCSGRAAARRHDLVWLDPGAPASLWHAAAAELPELRGWIERRLPLVVARRRPAPPPGRADWLEAGFTLPGTGARRRIAVSAAPRAVACLRPPLALDEAMSHAPAAWRAPMRALLRDCRAAGLLPRIYGSLATQIFSGEPCLRPGSDLDVLIDCESAAAVRAALDVLRRHANASPRLDGELRLASGWAVAWRELLDAGTAGAAARVLAKSDTAIALMPADRLLADAAPVGEILANAILAVDRHRLSA